MQEDTENTAAATRPEEGDSAGQPAPVVDMFTIPPLLQRSQDAFRRDLPGLLQRKELDRQWVAYHGDEQLRIARSQAELYEDCIRRGLQQHEFVVRCIMPDLPADLDVTPLHDV